MHTHAHAHTHTHTHTHTRARAHTHTHTRAHTHMHTDTHMDAHTRTQTHTHIDGHTHARTHAHSVSSCHYSKETDKLNVWVALLNLENMFGTPESLTSTFQQALQHNDPERVYWKMIGIYTKSGKTDVRVTGCVNGCNACGCVHVGVSM